MVHRIAGAVVVAVLAFAPAAGAAVTASTVSSPADGASFDVNLDDPGLITVTGTATADDPTSDAVRLVCTYSENPDGSAAVLAPPTAIGGLTPTGADTGTFSVEVSPSAFDYFTCRLRAVPAGAAPSDYRAFTGPVAHFSGHNSDPPNQPAVLNDFYQDISGPLGYWDGDSTSSCFVFSTYTLDPATLGYGQLFGCAHVSGGDPTGTRASLQVDGHDGFLPAEAHTSYAAITGGEPITGFVRRLDAPSGDVELVASEPIVRCANDATAYPPTCPAWADAGLIDRSTTVGSHGGRLVRHTDVWTNSDSSAHQVDVWYQLSTANAAPEWLFPGETAYAPHTAGEHSGAGGTITLPPAGAASVLVAADPAQADYLNPRGSITWSSVPSEIRFTAPNQLHLRYVRNVPAGGAAAISLAFGTDAAQANVDALSAQARAAMQPTVAITAPADGATVGTAAVTVTGRASDDGPVSVSVNDHAAAVAADRTWSVAVPLQPGANTLVATATDSDGNTAHDQRTVTLPTSNPAPPPHPSTSPPRIAPSNRFAFTVKRPKPGAKSIKLTLTVPGRGAIRAKLAASIPRTARTETLAKASKTATRAGKLELILRLNKKARAQLRKHRELKARLAVTFTPTGGSARTESKRLTLRPASKRH